MNGIRQIVLSCVLVAILGSSLHFVTALHYLRIILPGSIVKLAVFPQALIAANVDSATRQTAFLVAFGVTKAAGNFFVGAGVLF